MMDKRNTLEDSRRGKDYIGVTCAFVCVYSVLRELEGAPTHWVAVTFAAQVDPAQIKNNDPEKIEEIGWFTIKNLPKPLHSLVIQPITAQYPGLSADAENRKRRS